MDNLMAVFLGWLLGILGQRPIIYIQQSFKKSAIKKSIIAELEDLLCGLAMTSSVLLCRIGEIDKNYLQWVRPILRSYDGYYRYLDISDTVDKLLQTKDEDFEVAMKVIRSRANLNEGLTLRKFDMPFIDNNYKEIEMFDVRFQKDILEICRQVKNINEEIDNARFYFTKTFDSGLSENNGIIVRKNLESSYRNIAKMSINTTNNISAVVKRAT